MITFTLHDLATSAPLLLLAVYSLLSLMVESLTERGRTQLYWVGAAFHLVAAWMVMRLDSGWPFSGAAVTDNLFRLMAGIALIGNAAVIILWAQEGRTRIRVEPLVLTCLASIGVAGLSMANDLLLLIVAFEVMALAFYTLAGATRTEGSTEAALKYFLLGAFTFSFMALGAAYIFGATGSTNFTVIASRVSTLSPEGTTLLTLGIGLVMVGFAFELMLVPFHLWGPDVVQGAATPASAAISVIAKLATLAALARLLLVVAPGLEEQWGFALGALSVLSLLVGNLGAIGQSSVKRLLAYSSISHAGFLGLALISNLSAAAFYAVAYALMNLGAFAVVTAIESKTGEDPTLEDLAGLASENPRLAAAFSLFAASLAGVPLTAGFMAKVGLLLALWQKGYLGLAVVAAVASVIGFYYYFRMVSATLAPRVLIKPLAVRASLWLVVGLMALGVVTLGLVPLYPTALLALH